MKYVWLLGLVGCLSLSGCGPSKGVTEAPRPTAEPQNEEAPTNPGV